MILPVGLYVVVRIGGLAIPWLIANDLSARGLYAMVRDTVVNLDHQLFRLQYKDKKQRYRWLIPKQLIEDLILHTTGILYVNLRPFIFPPIVRNLTRDSLLLMHNHVTEIVSRGGVNLTLRVAINLKALELQSQFGDYRDGLYIPGLKSCIDFPPSGLVDSQLVTINAWIDGVIKSWHTKRNLHIMNTVEAYLTIVSKLPKYGVVYFQVWDEETVEKYLGISTESFKVYNPEDMSICEKEILWSNIEFMKFTGPKITVKYLQLGLKKVRFFMDDVSMSEEFVNLCEEYAKFNRTRANVVNQQRSNVSNLRTAKIVSSQNKAWSSLGKSKRTVRLGNVKQLELVYLKTFRKLTAVYSNN